jgi:hypothetical protein
LKAVQDAGNTKDQNEVCDPFLCVGGVRRCPINCVTVLSCVRPKHSPDHLMALYRGCELFPAGCIFASGLV